LERFIARHDGAAFEALVRRHGPLVWRVCRGILRNHHDAEDAFQATFLVLARNAPTIMPRGMLLNWLYGVARQTATKAKHVAVKRGVREHHVMVLPELEADPQPIGNDLHDALDEELSRLPAAYRAPIILCHLEGKAHQEAATQLGWPVGTLSGRLSRARRMLAERLSRRGFILPSGSLAVLSSWRAASASVPTSLVNATVMAAGGSTVVPVTHGLVSAEVAVLAKGVLKTMLLSKIKTRSLLLLLGAAIGIGLIAHSAEPRRRMRANGGSSTQKPAVPATPISKEYGTKKLLQELDWALTNVDTNTSRISALSRWTWNTMANDQFADSGIRTGLHLSFRDLPVARDAKILLDGKPAKLADLKIDKETFQERYGLQMTLQLSDDGSAITKIDARSQNSYFY
jgi:RNA polymerase sigma-70 factor (ECF subfamily)